MVVGAPPFVGVAAGELIAKHLFEDAEPPRARGAAISPALEAVVIKLLQKQPSDRYASANDVARALAQKPARASSSSLALPALAVTVALAAGGVALFAHLRHNPTPAVVATPTPTPAPIATPTSAPIATPPTPQPPPSPHPKPRPVSKKPAACDGVSGEHDSHCAPIESTP